jgi:[glutamine synthetase] adenylyltransferase / [glutamine synthetase]-adenylyl-L-tyrosine phosphorylase
MPPPEALDRLLERLPESHTPRVLYDRLVQDNPAIAKLFDRDSGLLLDALTLAAWSPLLATTLEQNPDYLQWLQRERVEARVRSREDLGESLARFALTHSTLDPHDMFARFRRRELLRIYLFDIRRVHTVAETTDELSNLADAVLEYALRLSRQRLDNLYGAPQRVDAEGRIAGTEFCVVALGKLGSRELNYASDIDLIFLFSHDGMTSAGGARGQITNREYYVKVAENILRLVSEPTGEGAAYRVDVRLRPHGREGTLACSFDEGVKYYKSNAQDWELQTLIRARCSAGADQLFNRFAAALTDQIYRPDVSVGAALESVHLSKQKIDIQRERSDKGFNVKLGRGGIREIEFIVQALQLAFGGRDEWLRAPHTLISMARLADRGLITETEYTQLSDAYQFWRCLEHRLQMEHGLQTHTLPLEMARRELVAKRMSFSGDGVLKKFDETMMRHTTNVRAAFDRVFGDTKTILAADARAKRQPEIAETAGGDAVSVLKAAAIFSKFLDVASLEHLGGEDECVDKLAALLRKKSECSLNSRRGLSLALRVARSLEKEVEPRAISLAELESLVDLCSTSEPIGELIASRPALMHSLTVSAEAIHLRDYLGDFSGALVTQPTFAAQLDELRRCWSAALVEIAVVDAAGQTTSEALNERLTALATASIDAALQIAQRELAHRYGPLAGEPRLTILGLGRLASGGMDYGSDIDIVAIYDSHGPSPVNGLSQEEAYARLVELMVAALSNLTREGSLYRVDLRLRPDGQKGPIVSSSDGFLSYVKNRAGIWEWLAYVKLRVVAGNREFGAGIESAARTAIHELARQIDARELAAETRRVRTRLEKERVVRRGTGVNIKHGAGGMIDVYFAVRYLQLRDHVPDHERDRTTLWMLAQLRQTKSLDENDFQALHDGYRLLRSVDHEMRLIVGRSATLPSAGHPALSDIARRLEYSTPSLLLEKVESRMRDIRAAYERVMEAKN